MQRFHSSAGDPHRTRAPLPRGMAQLSCLEPCLRLFGRGNWLTAGLGLEAFLRVTSHTAEIAPGMEIVWHVKHAASTQDTSQIIPNPQTLPNAKLEVHSHKCNFCSPALVTLKRIQVAVYKYPMSRLGSNKAMHFQVFNGVMALKRW